MRTDTLNILGEGNPGLAPVESARFLGVWLDRKLSFTKHQKIILQKMETQKLALERLAGKTWGVRLDRARQIYTMVVRSVMSYGANIWHTPTLRKGKARGIVRKLCSQQTKCLRTAIGAYKATPVRNVEAEAWCPPLDLYLTKWVAKAEQRLQRTGMTELLRTACEVVASRLRRRRPRRGEGRIKQPNSGILKAEWAKQWLQPPRWAQNSGGEVDWTELDPDRRLKAEWRARRSEQQTIALRRRTGRGMEPADLFNLRGKPPEHFPLNLHSGLTKAKSSLLTQLRTGAIGLNAFLFRMKARDVNTPLCRCVGAPETAAHIFLNCPEYAQSREQAGLPRVRDGSTFKEALSHTATAAKLMTWFYNTGRIEMYNLAREIERLNSEEEAAGGRKKVVAAREKRRREEEERSAKGRRRGRTVPGL